MTSRTLLLVAGPSGCGKSRLSRVATEAGGVATLPLDEFYRDLDHPGLPRTLGIVDWDDVASWDCDLAIETIRRLLSDGATEVPTYDISQSLLIPDARHGQCPRTTGGGHLRPAVAGRGQDRRTPG